MKGFYEGLAKINPEMAKKIEADINAYVARTANPESEVPAIEPTPVPAIEPTPVPAIETENREKGTRTKARRGKSTTHIREGTQITTTEMDGTRAHRERPDDLLVIHTEDGKITNLLDVTQTSISQYEFIIAIGRSIGYELRFSPRGLLSSHDLWVRDVPESVPGISYPRSFQVSRKATWKEIINYVRRVYSEVGILVSGLRNASLKDIPGESYGRYATSSLLGEDGETIHLSMDGGYGTADEDSKEKDNTLSRAIAKITNMFGGIAEGRATAMAAIGSNRYQCYQDSQEQKKWNAIGYGTSPMGSGWVPHASWFDPKLSEIQDEQLLPLLSDPEREVFMLQMGRALLGLEGELIRVPGGSFKTQKAKWRLFSIWEGRVGGLGRSTTFGLLNDGFKFLGLEAGALHDLGGKFGQAGNATKRWGFYDDLSSDDTTRLIGNGLLKSLVGGGAEISAEEKGEKDIRIKPRLVATLATNFVDPSAFAGLDPGIRSRLAVMRNRTGKDRESREYLEKYGHPVNVDRSYGAICDQYGITEQTLILLLLARSAEKFYTYSQMEDRNVSLVSHLDQLRKGFKVQVDLEYCEGIMRIYAEGLKLIDGGQDGSTGFIWKKFLGIINGMSGALGRQIDGCADTPEAVLSFVAEARKGGKSMVRSASTFFGLLTSIDGFGYPDALSYWSSMWLEYRDSYDWSKPPILDKRAIEDKPTSKRTPEDAAIIDKIASFINLTQ